MQSYELSVEQPRYNEVLTANHARAHLTSVEPSQLGNRLSITFEQWSFPMLLRIAEQPLNANGLMSPWIDFMAHAHSR